MKTCECENAIPEVDFQPAGRDFLTAFYRDKGIDPDDTAGKIRALRENFIKERMLIASHDGIIDDVSELRALEYYVLDSLNFQI